MFMWYAYFYKYRTELACLCRGIMSHHSTKKRLHHIDDDLGAAREYPEDLILA